MRITQTGNARSTRASVAGRVVGLVLLVAVLPVILVAAAVAAVALRSFPFFVQRRVGLDGREFGFVKIRTLPVSTPPYATKYELDGVAIPRVCHFLRNRHLDELPQLLLVAAGRMKLVGPRPEMPTLHETFDPAFAALRTSVLPGCIGLWQASVDNHRLIAEAPEYDAYYVRNRNWKLDAWIVARTALHLLIGPRVELVGVPRWAAEPSVDAYATTSPAPLTPLA